jgi:hypothetical protein
VLLFEAVAQRDPEARAATVPRAPTPRADHPTDPTVGPRPVPDEDPAPTAAPRSQDLAANEGETDTASTDRADSGPDEPVPDAETELLPGEAASAPTPRPRKPRAPRSPHA